MVKKIKFLPHERKYFSIFWEERGFLLKVPIGAGEWRLEGMGGRLLCFSFSFFFISTVNFGILS